MVKAGNKTIEGVFWLLAANAATKLLWAGSIIMLMHSLGPTDYGLLATTWAAAGLAAGLTDFGAGQAMLREASRDAGKTLPFLRVGIVIKTCLTIPLWIAVVASSVFLLQGKNASSAWLIAIILAAGAPLVDHYQAFFTYVTQIMHRLDVFAFWRTGYFLAVLLAFATASYLHGTILWVSVAYFVLTLVYALAFGWRIFLLAGGGEYRASSVSVREAVQTGLPFLGTTMLGLAYYRLDVMLLGYLGSDYAAGIYSGQYQLILVFYMIPGVIFSALFPDLYRNSRNKDYLQQRFTRVCRYLNVLAWLATPCLFFEAKEIMLLLGGRAFAEDYHSLRILCFFVPMFVFGVALNFLTTTDRLASRIRCEVAALGITLVGGVLAVPSYSTDGMSLVALIAYAASGIPALAILAREDQISLKPMFKDVLTMSLVMGPALAVFWLPLPYWWLECVLFWIAAAAGLLVARFWDEADRELLRNFMTLFTRTDDRTH